MDTNSTPRDTAAGHDISVVVVVRDVARHLPAFLESLEAQVGADRGRVQVVVVDDGSGDDALSALHAWEERTAFAVIVLPRLHAGTAAARNLGLAHATGRWLTFAEPQDVLDPEYLARVLAFLTEHPDTELVMTGTAALSGHDHSRQWRATPELFAPVDQPFDLTGAPDVFCTTLANTVLRRDRVLAAGLEFDPAVHPAFGDAHFAARYLMACPAPVVALLPQARYLQRREGGRSVPAVYADPALYLSVPRSGYLALLDGARERYGRVPEWLQSLVVHELSGFFKAEQAASGAPAPPREVCTDFLAALREVRGRLEDHVVAGFQASALEATVRQVIAFGLVDRSWSSPVAVIEKTDPEQGLVRVATRFTGPEPRTVYSTDAGPVDPVQAKLRVLRFFGADLIRERIVWLPLTRQLRVSTDDMPLELRSSWPGATPTSLVPAHRPDPQRPVETLLGVALTQPGRASRAARRRALTRLAETPSVRRRYAGAWVLMDRIQNADDNAEHLFRYLREHRPDVNAWFTVEAGSPDHRRLKAGPHGDRVVAHGSLQWLLLMLNCRHLVSSHVDVPVKQPAAVLRLLKPAQPPWKFTFLQHGVIKDDISNWLNPKLVDLFVTSTPAEYASIADDGTPYAYTGRETVLTGLPRFDRLQEISRSLGPKDRDLILVAPTWREWLQSPRTSFGDHRRKLRDDFGESEYARCWLGLLRSPDLADLARDHGLRIGFLPHPNLQPLLPALDLPAHVEPLSFDGGGAQRLFASAATLVTDYSSMAFNAACVDRPVVYFQFDREVVQRGGHLGRAGYFDYDRDGFGPVTRTIADTVAAIDEIAGRGGTPASQYQERIDATFVMRDGRCCERVTAAIEALDRPAGQQPAASA